MDITYKEYKKQNIKIGAVLLLFLVAMGFMQFFVGILTGIGVFFEASKVFTVIYDIVYSVSYFCMFFIPMLMYKLFDRDYKFSYMPCRVKFSKNFILLLIIGLGLNYIAAYINAVAMAVIGFDLNELLGEQYPNGYHGYNFILDTVKMAIIPAFVEELLFRGLIQDRLARFGRLKAMVISSLLFALMHQNPAQMFYTFILGMTLGYIAFESGSIWGCIVLHFINNFTQVITTAVQYTQPEGRAIFIIYIIELIIICAGFLAALYYFIRHGKKRLFNDEWLSYPVNSITKWQAVKGFLTPTNVIFAVASIIAALSLFLLPLINKLGEYYGI